MMPFAFQVTESALLRDAVAALGLRLLAAGAGVSGQGTGEFPERDGVTPGPAADPAGRHAISPGGTVSSSRS
jgi:hypothetical protein